jgi:hypothetical protein
VLSPQKTPQTARLVVDDEVEMSEIAEVSEVEQNGLDRPDRNGDSKRVAAKRVGARQIYSPDACEGIRSLAILKLMLLFPGNSWGFGPGGEHPRPIP